MFSTSQTTGYAILALGCLEEPGGRWVLAQEIAGSTRIPKPYLSKILHALRRSGLIRAKRGYCGGFALGLPMRSIRLLDVVLAVEGPGWLPRCMLGLADCSAFRLCPTHGFWRAERKRIEAVMRRLTMVEVCAALKENPHYRPAAGSAAGHAGK